MNMTDRDDQAGDADQPSRMPTDHPSDMIVEGEAEHIDPDDNHDRNKPR
jgi:hypothetical protein